MITSANDSGEKKRILDQYHAMILRKTIVFAAAVTAIILFVGLVALSVYDSISLSETYRLIWYHITGQPCPAQYAYRDMFVWDWAIPYAIAAIVSGACLACCGTLMQSLMGNPLADPYSTGVSSGACLGAVASIAMGISIATFAGTGTIVNAFVGAMIPTAIIILISEKIPMSPAVLILIGTALSIFFGSLITLVMVSAGAEPLQEAYLWQVGNFSKVTWDTIPLMVAVTAVGSAVVMLMTKKLNIMALGDDSAQSLGIDVKQFRTLALTLMAVMTAGIVSFVGIIGFIGLLCPHIVRLMCGSDNRFVVPISMAIGALLLLIANYVAIIFGKLPVGVVMNCVGAPLFFILIILSRNTGKGALY